MPRTLIVGGGIIGAAVAWACTQRGMEVVVVEREHWGASRATGQSGGIVRRFAREPWHRRLACRAFQTFPRWAERVGGTCGWQRTGALSLLGPELQKDDLLAIEEMREMGTELEILQVSELAHRRPDMCVEGVALALYDPGGGYIDPRAATASLLSAARHHGARTLEQWAYCTLRVGDGVRGIEEGNDFVDSDKVVLCNNAGAMELLATIGITLPIETRRILLQRVRSSVPPDRRIVCIDHAWDSYHRFTNQGEALIGCPSGPSGVDPQAPGMADEDQLKYARDVAVRRLPCLEGATLQEVRAGMDTYTPDRRPIVGPVPGVNGLYLALAFNGCGVKVAPAIGALVCDHLTGESTESDDDLLPSRFFRQHNIPVKP